MIAEFSSSEKEGNTNQRRRLLSLFHCFASSAQSIEIESQQPGADLQSQSVAEKNLISLMVSLLSALPEDQVEAGAHEFLKCDEWRQLNMTSRLCTMFGKSTSSASDAACRDGLELLRVFSDYFRAYATETDLEAIVKFLLRLHRSPSGANGDVIDDIDPKDYGLVSQTLNILCPALLRQNDLSLKRTKRTAAGSFNQRNNSLDNNSLAPMVVNIDSNDAEISSDGLVAYTRGLHSSSPSLASAANSPVPGAHRPLAAVPDLWQIIPVSDFVEFGCAFVEISIEYNDSAQSSVGIGFFDGDSAREQCHTFTSRTPLGSLPRSWAVLNNECVQTPHTCFFCC